MGNDYIKREDVLTLIDKGYLINNGNYKKEKKLIDSIPSANVVEVVRCKDCKWWDGIECQTRDIDVVDDGEYCSYGEKKEQEHE